MELLCSVNLHRRNGIGQNAAPIGKHFGDILTDVKASYVVGDSVTAQFVGANPRAKCGSRAAQGQHEREAYNHYQGSMKHDGHGTSPNIYMDHTAAVSPALRNTIGDKKTMSLTLWSNIYRAIDQAISWLSGEKVHVDGEGKLNEWVVPTSMLATVIRIVSTSMSMQEMPLFLYHLLAVTFLCIQISLVILDEQNDGTDLAGRRERTLAFCRRP
ncbi:uncharacterized protein EV420DRAFT_1754702 [Desarmillaria tabescens]|uniref:Neutral/alkaline non-lysosomal ceramidase C-terminal domain-containing protein n=1 Tax=Armillaria tabescens TaxID=1929756 RepID=A0AA39J0K0_ARMTA|nr:uncharacterized protein EV420DRAFT_1754702 [Desarmillaria tabescens]KAK0433912.1 hypothetical protein EV420DRAFT_1754702 [Desarmillaria tabescens]